MGGWLRNIVGETLTVTLEQRPGEGTSWWPWSWRASAAGRRVAVERCPAAVWRRCA